MAKNLDEWRRRIQALIADRRREAREGADKFTPLDWSKIGIRFGDGPVTGIPKFDDWNWPEFRPITDESYVGNDRHPYEADEAGKAATKRMHRFTEDIDRITQFHIRLAEFYRGSGIRVVDCQPSAGWGRTMSTKISDLPSGPWVRDLRPYDSYGPRWHDLDVDYD